MSEENEMHPSTNDRAANQVDEAIVESDELTDDSDDALDDSIVEGFGEDVNDIPSNPENAQKATIFQNFCLTMGEIARQSRLKWLQKDVDKALREIAKELYNLKKQTPAEDDDELPRVIKKVEFFQDMFTRLKASAKHADYFSFSMLRKAAYPRLGLKELPRASIGRHVFQKDSSRGFWDKAEACGSRGMSAYLSASLKVWSRRGETLARILINPILKDAALCCANEGDEIFITPELTISAKKKPAVVEGEDCQTFLSGSADYALFRSLSTVKRETELAKKLEQLSTLKHILKAFNGKTPLSQVEPMLFESKLEKENADDLEKDLPQMLGESIGVCVVSQIRGLKWCLTTGSQWLFGLLEVEEAEVPSSFQYRVVQSFTLPLYRKTGFKSEFATLFIFLVYWIHEPFENIRDQCRVDVATQNPKAGGVDGEDYDGGDEEEEEGGAKKKATKKKAPKKATKEEVHKESTEAGGAERELNYTEEGGKRRSQRKAKRTADK